MAHMPTDAVLDESGSPMRSLVTVEDFRNLDNVTAAVTGDATVTIVAPESPAPGMIGQVKLALNTAGDGAAINICDSVQMLTLPQNSNDESNFICCWRLQVADGDAAYNLQAGVDAQFAAATYGARVCFRAGTPASVNNNGNWFAVVDDGTETAVDTGVAVTDDNVILKLDMTKQRCLFYIDGTLVATISSGLPTGFSVGVTLKFKSVTTYTGELLADYVWFTSTKER